ncbi:hypothetical protein [Kitasatospora sp. NPDC002040]|uniref:hypothetical protein n=1 Tax=Kitasatospora sp. NPDC002040 TaxID=3154661 RepID=UPI0033309595
MSVDEDPGSAFSELAGRLRVAVNVLGVSGIDRAARDMVHLDVTAWSNGDVADAWADAHELVVGHWYSHAYSRRMTAWERAVALHLVGEELFPRRPAADSSADDIPAADVSALVAQGAALVPVELLEDLADALHEEQGRWDNRPVTPQQRERRALLKRWLPDFNRRRYCLRTARQHGYMHSLSTPLVVNTGSGERFLGASVPDSPELHLRESTHRQQRLAERAQRAALRAPRGAGRAV